MKKKEVSELVYVRSTDSKRSGLFGLLDTRIEGGIHPQQLAMINQLEVRRDVYHMRVRLPDNTAETTSLDGQARATWTQHNSSSVPHTDGGNVARNLITLSTH